MVASHRLVEHTAEVALRLRADSLGELFAEAARGLAELSLRGAPPATPSGAGRAITLTAPDAAALLVDWLNELIYLGETERWVALETEMEGVTPKGLHARARGITLERAPSLVKAATLHRLDVVSKGGTGPFEAEVLFDV